MHIRCPHCRHAIEIVEDASADHAQCPSCGSTFSLADQTRAHRPTLRSVAHFTIIEELGSGGFGIVFKALDTKLDRLVALKVPRRDQVDSENVEMFLREARAAAQLRHPNIVAVHEVGCDDETPYIVSDLIVGVTLADRLTTGTLTGQEAAQIASQVAAALHHAHSAGVIHRDLKPQNVILDDQHNVHLMDFGLAKRDAGEITMTIDGKILGTAAYMPPEQARGEGQRVDRRADIYSLGVILYELLTGERPFRGNFAMLLHQVIHDDPPSPRKLNVRVPRDLETIVLKCMEKEPRRRYQTAKEVNEELERYLAGEPVLARPISQLEKLWRWSRRNPTVAGMAGGLAIVLSLFAISGIAVAYRESISHARTAKLLDEKTGLVKSIDSSLIKQRQLTTEATHRRLEAERERRLSDAYRLAVQSQAIRGESPLQAISLARESVETTRRHQEPVLPIAKSALREALRFTEGTGVGELASIENVIVSSDHRWLCVWGTSGQSAVFDCQSAGPRWRRLDLPSAACLAISADSTRIAAALRDNGKVLVWNLSTEGLGAEPIALEGSFYPSNALQFSMDGKRLAGFGGGIGHIWDLSTRKIGHAWTATRWTAAATFSATFSPDGMRFAAGGTDGKVRLWNFELPEPDRGVLELANDVGMVSVVRFSPNQRWLIWGNSNGTLYRCDLTAPDPTKSVLKLSAHVGPITALAFSQNGNIAATGGADHAVRIWEVDKFSPEIAPRTLSGHSGEISSLGFFENDHWLSSTSVDRSVRLWPITDLDPMMNVHRLCAHSNPVVAANYIPGVQCIITASSDGYLHRWNWPVPTMDSMRWKLLTPDNRIEWSTFGSDGRLLAILTSTEGNPDVAKYSLRNWNLPIRGPVGQFSTGIANGILLAAISHDSRRLATWSEDKLRIDDLGEGGVLTTKEYETGGFVSAAFLADKDQLILHDFSGKLRIWNVTTDFGTASQSDKELPFWIPEQFEVADGWIAERDGEEIVVARYFLKDNQSLRVEQIARDKNSTVICLCPDGRWLAVGDAAPEMDYAFRLWDLSAADPLKSAIRGKGRERVTSFAFSKDGQRLAVGEQGGAIRIFFLTKPLSLEAADEDLGAHRSAVTRLQFSERGDRLFSLDGAGTIREWVVGVDELIERAEQLISAEPLKGQQLQQDPPR